MKSSRLILLTAALLTSCSFEPSLDKPGVEVVPVSFSGNGNGSASATLEWRSFFTDPRLKKLVGTALENNRDLRVAAANVLAARAQHRVQRADQFPTVAAGASATLTNQSAQGAVSGVDVDIYQAQVGVSAFEVDLFGRVRNLSRAALEQYFASEEAERAARISLIAEIATAWLNLAADRDQLSLSREVLETYAQTRELTQAQFRVGTASELEARQADTEYQAARNDIAVLETRIAQDRNALELLVGAPVADELLPTGLTAQGATIPELPVGLSSQVLLRRPDLLQAEHQLIAQHANIGAARAAMFPTISLTAALGVISQGLSGLFSGGAFTYNVAPAVDLPIFDAGRRRANVDLAEANRQAALATYEKSIQTAFREVADALAQRGTIGEQMAAQTARVDSAQTAAMLADARYRAGVTSFLESLVTQRASYTARQELVSTRLARETNLVTLYRSLGGGLS